MKTVDYSDFLNFLSSFPFETEGLFNEADMNITYNNKLTGVAIARAHISDKEEPFMHHGIYCSKFEVATT